MFVLRMMDDSRTTVSWAEGKARRAVREFPRMGDRRAKQ